MAQSADRMITTPPAPHTGSASPPAAPGLGGPLWLFAWGLAALPLWLTTRVVAQCWRAASHYSSNDMTIWVAFLLLLSFLAMLWRSAQLFFARDPKFLRSWIVCSFTAFAVAMMMRAMDSLRYDADGLQWADVVDAARQYWPIAAFAVSTSLYLSLSPHARHTFRSGTTAGAAWGPRWLPDAVRFGPDDWSRGFWLLPGFLLSAIVLHLVGSQEYAGDAFQAMPTASAGLDPSILGSGISKAAMITVRLQWLTHVLALCLLPFATLAFMRRAQWLPALAFSVAILAVVAPGLEIVIDPPPYYLDGPDHEVEALRAVLQLIVLVLLLRLPATRARFIRTHSTTLNATP